MNRWFLDRKLFLFEGDDGGAGGGSSEPGRGGDQNDPPADGDSLAALQAQNEALTSELGKIKAAQKAAAEKQAEADGKWQQLAEQRATELEQERTERLKLTVATQKGLPADLVGRLQGKTEEEIAADADALLKFMKPAEGPGIPPAGRGNNSQGLDLAKMSPEDIRKNKARLWKENVSGR